jgi:hypothetical protein
MARIVPHSRLSVKRNPTRKSSAKRNGYEAAGWSKIYNSLPDHPKIAVVGPLAELLWIHAILYCGRYQTDGFIPAAIMHRLVDWDHDRVWVAEALAVKPVGVPTLHPIDPDGFSKVSDFELAHRLIDIGLIHEVDGGYRIHDYLRYQRSSATIADAHGRMSDGGRQGGVNSGLTKKARSLGEGSTKGTAKPQSSLSEADTDSESESSSFSGEDLLGDLQPSLSAENGLVDKPSLSGFAEFWKAYPKKRHRPAATKAWKAITPNLGLRERILAGVAAWCESDQWKTAGKIEDPATFLNQRQWEDGPIQAQPDWKIGFLAKRAAEEAAK